MTIPGIFDYEAGDSPASTPATAVEVLRYEGGAYEPMPNLQVLEVQKREGLEPMTAHIAYILDDLATAFGWPAEFEQIMALSSAAAASDPDSADAGRYVIQPDQRLVIRTTDGAGYSDILFDGFAQAPQVHFSKGRQQVSFVAVGVAIRLYDYPVMDFRQAWQGLNSDQLPKTGGVYNGVVQAAARFNPEGEPNCTPKTHWFKPAGDAGAYPIFYENARIDSSGTVAAAPWTLALAARYILSYHLGENDFVAFPDLDSLDRVLNRRMPVAQKPYEVLDTSLLYDPRKPSTYTEEPVVLRDFDMSGIPWPEAFDQMLRFSGFAAEFATHDRGDGFPRTVINVYRKDAGGPYDPKTIGLQPRRAGYDPSLSSLESFGVVRDYKDAFNAVTMDAYPALFEVSIVLAMKGPIDAGDAVNPEVFNSSAAAGDDPRYRVWFADELGEGHVGRDGLDSQDACDFTDVFAGMYVLADGQDPPQAVRRTRPARGELLTVDIMGEPKSAALYLSRDYEGETAKPWDGTGTWQRITHGWELLDDRFGVKLTADNLDAWTIGDSDGDQAKGPLVRVITSMAVDREPNSRFFLRLVGVVEADARGFNDFAGRKSSPFAWDRYRYISGKTSYQRTYVHESSPYFTGDANEGRGATTDQDAAIAGYMWMGQVQAAGENPSVAGPMTIPYHSREYQIGDRISAIDGRSLSLQVNQGTDDGEAPAYPFVVGISWTFGDRESTTLELSDHRSRGLG